MTETYYMCPESECKNSEPYDSLMLCVHMSEDHGWSVEQLEAYNFMTVVDKQ